MRVDCGQLDPGAVIRPVVGEWQPRMPDRLDNEELADWRAGRNAVYQLAAPTIGARPAVADGYPELADADRPLSARSNDPRDPILRKIDIFRSGRPKIAFISNQGTPAE